MVTKNSGALCSKVYPNMVFKRADPHKAAIIIITYVDPT